MRYELKTEIQEDDVIASELTYEFDDIRQTIQRQVCATQDEQVKAALIKLGWTPPDETEKLKQRLAEYKKEVQKLLRRERELVEARDRAEAALSIIPI